MYVCRKWGGGLRNWLMWLCSGESEICQSEQLNRDLCRERRKPWVKVCIDKSGSRQTPQSLRPTEEWQALPCWLRFRSMAKPFLGDPVCVRVDSIDYVHHSFPLPRPHIYSWKTVTQQWLFLCRLAKFSCLHDPTVFQKQTLPSFWSVCSSPTSLFNLI